MSLADGLVKGMSGGEDENASSTMKTMMAVVGIALAIPLIGAALNGMFGGDDISPLDLTGQNAISPTPTPGVGLGIGTGIGL